MQLGFMAGKGFLQIDADGFFTGQQSFRLCDLRLYFLPIILRLIAQLFIVLFHS